MAEVKGEVERFNGMINNFLVGCDPEFAALDGQGQQINLTDKLRVEGEIGYDHNGRLGELRPKPAKGTYALVKRLHKLINSETVRNLQAAKLRAGARVGRDTLGGHVHLGFEMPAYRPIEYDLNPQGQIQYDATGNVRLRQTTPDARITALDRVTRVLENLDILPREESISRRRGNYGKFSDVRDSNGHLEYRTMASWLFDPKVAYLCLTGAKLAAADAEGTLESLREDASFQSFVGWFDRYKRKDANARRAVERVLDQGHRGVQVSPDVDFRERWREIGL